MIFYDISKHEGNQVEFMQLSTNKESMTFQGIIDNNLTNLKIDLRDIIQGNQGLNIFTPLTEKVRIFRKTAEKNQQAKQTLVLKESLKMLFKLGIFELDSTGDLQGLEAEKIYQILMNHQNEVHKWVRVIAPLLNMIFHSNNADDMEEKFIRLWIMTRIYKPIKVEIGKKKPPIKAYFSQLDEKTDQNQQDPRSQMRQVNAMSSIKSMTFDNLSPDTDRQAKSIRFSESELEFITGIDRKCEQQAQALQYILEKMKHIDENMKFLTRSQKEETRTKAPTRKQESNLNFQSDKKWNYNQQSDSTSGFDFRPKSKSREDRPRYIKKTTNQQDSAAWEKPNNMTFAQEKQNLNFSNQLISIELKDNNLKDKMPTIEEKKEEIDQSLGSNTARVQDEIIVQPNEHLIEIVSTPTKKEISKRKNIKQVAPLKAEEQKQIMTTPPKKNSNTQPSIGKQKTPNRTPKRETTPKKENKTQTQPVTQPGKMTYLQLMVIKNPKKTRPVVVVPHNVFSGQQAWMSERLKDAIVSQTQKLNPGKTPEVNIAIVENIKKKYWEHLGINEEDITYEQMVETALKIANISPSTYQYDQMISQIAPQLETYDKELCRLLSHIELVETLSSYINQTQRELYELEDGHDYENDNEYMTLNIIEKLDQAGYSRGQPPAKHLYIEEIISEVDTTQSRKQLLVERLYWQHEYILEEPPKLDNTEYYVQKIIDRIRHIMEDEHWNPQNIPFDTADKKAIRERIKYELEKYGFEEEASTYQICKDFETDKFGEPDGSDEEEDENFHQYKENSKHL